MAVDTAAVLEEGPDVGLDMTLQEAEPFLGEIVVDQWEAGKAFNDQAGKTQLHLGFKPLSFEIRGQTGMFHDYYNLSSTKRSKMGYLITAFKELIGKDGVTPVNRDLKFGKGQLIGIRAWFVRKDISFGRNSEGTEMQVQITLPVRLATADDISQYAIYTDGTRAAGENAPVQADWTPEETMALVEHYAGQTPSDAQRSALKNKALTPAMKNAIMTGAALGWLQNRGHVTVENGVINAGVPA